MSLFRRKPAPPEIVEETTVEDELPLAPQERRFDGAVVFGSDGVHYPVAYDDAGSELGPDRSRPLRYNADGAGWFFYLARPEDPTHYHAYHVGHADITPES